MELHDGDVDTTDGFEDAFGLVTARTQALLPGASAILQQRAIVEAQAAEQAASDAKPFYTKPIFLIGTALAAVGIVGTVLIYKKRKARRMVTAMADLMAEANCTKKRNGECECWEFSDGQRVCLR
jgi:hypothetical protein